MSQEMRALEELSPSPWKPLFHCFHSSTSPETRQETQQGVRLCQVAILSQVGEDGAVGSIPVEMGNKAGRWEKVQLGLSWDPSRRLGQLR